MPPIVETRSGPVSGTEEEGLHVFHGIPFAQPPLGDLRWQPPQPTTPWTEPLEATSFGPAAPQAGGPISRLLSIDLTSTSEDCLTLNIWTPGLDEANRPVLVWIHGGAFIIGSGSQAIYDGQHLARRGDVVVVTVNYRLGVFGFLHAPELGASGNEGLLDQVAALRWVRDNIATFGGDPANITVFGESAGAFSIGSLFAMPEAHGTFDKAILQSGSISVTDSASQSSERASRTLNALLDTLGIALDDAGQLRSFSTATLMDAVNRMPVDVAGGSVPFGPVIDGEVIPVEAAQAIAAGANTRGVPLLLGTTRDEMTLFTMMDPEVAELDEAGLAGRIERLMPGMATDVIAQYRDARAARGEPVTPRDLLVAILTDAVFRIGAVRTAELQLQHTFDVWMYLFDWESPWLGGALRSCHALDLPFTFDTLHVDQMPEFAGGGDAAIRLSHAMMDAWITFARNGTPDCDALPAWPRYDTGRRATMRLGEQFGIIDAPYEAERQVWAALGQEATPV